MENTHELVRISSIYKEKLRKLAGQQKRSMSKTLEILIDQATEKQTETEEWPTIK